MPASLSSPFIHSELRGYFICDRDFIDRLREGTGDQFFYHSAHANHVRQFFLAENEVTLRSHFDVQLHDDDDDSLLPPTACFWASFHDWHNAPPYFHNHHGSLSVKLLLSRLIGRRFYVFKRIIPRYGTRYYFVQRESTTPLFGKGRGAARTDPARFFVKTSDGLRRRVGAQYEVCLTEPVTLRKSKIIAHPHKSCITRQCKSLPISEDEAISQLKEMARAKLEELASQMPQLNLKNLAPSEPVIRCRVARRK